DDPQVGFGQPVALFDRLRGGGRLAHGAAAGREPEREPRPDAIVRVSHHRDQRTVQARSSRRQGQSRKLC
ncbi:hypothetical protein DP116_28070, partial [Brasilonema bromeliae SPC951]|nr:hypothetical protein [Brasilonema bromeliae SPC951]